ncbi:MAG: STAS domain-containing protein [Myxococcales bacterium]|nr:STAS domain-containing protein [Myxococcales bacterium]
MNSGLDWKRSESGDWVVLDIGGSISEASDFGALLEAAGPKVRLDLKGLKRINSSGVREWMRFITSLANGREIELHHVSPPFVQQLNIVANFAGGSKIVSVMLPYVCDACGHEEERVLEVAGSAPAELPEIQCGECDEAMAFDDIPDSYFGFLKG